jgi:hypothetical protein
MDSSFVLSISRSKLNAIGVKVIPDIINVVGKRNNIDFELIYSGSSGIVYRPTYNTKLVIPECSQYMVVIMNKEEDVP